MRTSPWSPMPPPPAAAAVAAAARSPGMEAGCGRRPSESRPSPGKEQGSLSHAFLNHKIYALTLPSCFASSSLLRISSCCSAIILAFSLTGMKSSFRSASTDSEADSSCCGCCCCTCWTRVSKTEVVWTFCTCAYRSRRVQVFGETKSVFRVIK